MTLAELLVCLLVGAVAALAAGAVSGVWIGASDLGRILAASLGLFFGGIAGSLAVLLGLIVVAVLR